jgi:peptidoglycan/xylan/chitin deacetylase (PgdA/CDA1 family)
MRCIALEYHDIVDDDRWESSGFRGAAANSYKLNVDRFGAHLRAVQQLGVHIKNDIRESDGTPETVVVWTFDDGGHGYHARAADLLEDIGWRGHLFMTTAQIGKPGFLSTHELRDLYARGHVVGSHSHSHPARMADLSAASMHEEWRASVLELEDTLGAPVQTGSVPGGFYAPEVARAASASGLRHLFTSEPVIRTHVVASCIVYGRFTLRQHHDAGYAAKLVSRASARWNQWAFWNAKKIAKSLGGNTYANIRHRFFER